MHLLQQNLRRCHLSITFAKPFLNFRMYWMCLCHPSLAELKQVAIIGPSEVRALPVRRCRRAAWQT